MMNDATIDRYIVMRARHRLHMLLFIVMEQCRATLIKAMSHACVMCTAHICAAQAHIRMRIGSTGAQLRTEVLK